MDPLAQDERISAYLDGELRPTHAPSLRRNWRKTPTCAKWSMSCVDWATACNCSSVIVWTAISPRVWRRAERTVLTGNAAPSGAAGAAVNGPAANGPAAEVVPVMLELDRQLRRRRVRVEWREPREYQRLRQRVGQSALAKPPALGLVGHRGGCRDATHGLGLAAAEATAGGAGRQYGAASWRCRQSASAGGGFQRRKRRRCRPSQNQ